MRIKAKKLYGEDVEGEALVSKEPINFYLADPETGKYLEKNHPLEGKSLAGRILVIPSGKGSSVVQLDGLFQLVKRGKAPKGVIAGFADAVLISACVVSGVTLVHRPEKNLLDLIEDGYRIRISGDYITIEGR